MEKRNQLILLFTVLAVFILSSPIALVKAQPPPPPSGGLWDLPAWVTATVGAAMVLAFLSMVVVQENPFARWAEYSIVGLGVGYGFIVTFWAMLEPGGYLDPLLTGADPTLIIPVFLGILLYAQFFRRARWVIRWPLAFMMSVGFTVGIVGTPTIILKQIAGIAVPLTSGSAYEIVNALIVIVGVVCTLSYFTFSQEHTGALGVSAKIGRLFMMLGFGAGFGIAVMSQGSYLINVLTFLLRDWLGVLA